MRYERTKIALLEIALLLIASSVLGCGDSDVVTGAWMEVSTTIPFSGSTDVQTDTINITGVADYKAIAGAISCGYLDETQSSVVVTKFAEGVGDNGFELKAALIDGQNDLTLFTWKKTLEAGKAVVPFSELEINADTKARIGSILASKDANLDFRWSLSADPGTDEVEVQVVQVFRVATTDGSCPQ